MEEENSSMSQEAKKNQLKFFIKDYFFFLLIGLANAAVLKITLNYRGFFENVYSIVLTEALFLAIVFFLDEVLISKIKNIALNYLVFYLTSGLGGLFIIEIIVNGNLKAGPAAIIFLFLFRAGMPTMAKALLNKRVVFDCKYKYAEKILILYALYVFFGFFFYYMFKTILAWQTSIIIFYILLNIILMLHIKVLSKTSVVK